MGLGRLGWVGNESYLKDEKFVNALDGDVPDLVMWPNGNSNHSNDEEWVVILQKEDTQT